MLQSLSVPSPYGTRVSTQFVTDLLPGEIVNVSVAKHHAFICVGNRIDDASYLILEIYEKVDLIVDIYL